MNLASYYGPFIVRETFVSLPMAAVGSIVGEDYSRVYLRISTPSTNGCQVSTKRTVGSSQGMFVNNGVQGALILHWAQDSILCGQAWFGFSATVLSLSVIEIIQDHEPVAVQYPTNQRAEDVTGEPPVEDDFQRDRLGDSAAERAPRRAHIFGPIGKRVRAELHGNGSAWRWNPHSRWVYPVRDDL